MFLLICWPVFGIDNVHAQDPTDTPTPTNEPLFRTPTAKPALNLQCSGSQPIGWGTVTPDPSWLMNCSQCVTPVAGYDWGPNPFDGTPVASLTPTVTPTVAVTYEYIGHLLDNTVILPEVERFTTLSGLSGQPVFARLNIRSNTTVTIRTKQTMSLRLSANYNMPDWGGSYPEVLKLVINSDVLADVNVICITGCTSVDLTNDGDGTTEQILDSNPYGLYGSKTIIANIEWYPVLNDDFQFSLMGAGNSGQSYATQHEWTYQSSDYFMGAPTPTPIVSDCSTVTADGGGSGGDDNFDLPEISIGWGRCLTIGGWTIGLAWAQQFIPSIPESWTVPGLQICFKPITFGSLNLFGLAVDLDLIASVMAGVLIIRIIRT